MFAKAFTTVPPRLGFHLLDIAVLPNGLLQETVQ